MSESTDADLEDLLATATQKATGTLIHEARPLVTDIVDAAEEELGERFKGSVTSRAIARMQEFLVTMSMLHDASHPPAFVEFDLTALVSDLIADRGFAEMNVVATRADPAIVQGDPNLLKLSLDNVIRNAVEASFGSRVVVHCAATDRDAWVAVLDEGVGLPQNIQNAFAPGVSTKSKDTNFGMGLAIVDQAVRSMRGSVLLAPREAGGTSCEIRWRQSLQEPA